MSNALDSMASLQRQARADLETPRRGVLLEWSFLVGEASGALKAAEVCLVQIEHFYRDLRSALHSRFSPDNDDPRALAMVEEAATLQQSLARQRDKVGVAAAMVRAAELTLHLLEKRVARTEQEES